MPDGDHETRLQLLERDMRRVTNALVDWLPFLTLLQEREAASVPSAMAIVTHTVVVVALIAAATTLTLSGHDASAVWAAVGVYPAGAGVQALTSRRPIR